MVQPFVIKRSNSLLFKGFFVVCAVIVLLPVTGYNQIDSDTDSITVIAKKNSRNDSAYISRHNPSRASIYSMILPGLGQAYNKKYWKIPIVYAGFGVFYYFISFNDKEYKAWREAYNHSLSDPDNLDPPVNEYERLYGDKPEILQDQKNYYRRNRDLTYILSGLWYLLNIVDATVDAHLFSWEIDDKLSLKFEPTLYEPMYGNSLNGGLRFTLNFK
jgi:hypothetical protein